MVDRPERKTKNTRVEGYLETYANNCNMRASNWDFFFEFGKVANINEQEIEINSEVAVYMSPQQAKVFLKVFTDNVAQFEKTFGTIVFEPKAAEAK